MSGRKSTFGGAFAKHPPYRDRLAETLECVLSNKRVFEEIRSETMRRRADQNPAGLGHGLKAGRQIRRVPYDRFRTCRTHMRRFADDHEARRDPNASL